MKRTLDNCSVIKKCLKCGIGKPKQFKELNRCDGYIKSDYDDEPYEICMQCKLNTSYGVE